MGNTNVNQDAENSKDAERVARWNWMSDEDLLNTMLTKAFFARECANKEDSLTEIRDCYEMKAVLFQRLQVPHATEAKGNNNEEAEENKTLPESKLSARVKQVGEEMSDMLL
jgi:hypothetical protein